MKSLATKLLAILFVMTLAAGCASSITSPGQIDSQQKISQQDPHHPGNVKTGHDMIQSVKKPNTGVGW